MAGFDCPQCHYHARVNDYFCLRCHHVFHDDEQEERSHLEYAIARIEEWRQRHLLPEDAAERLLGELHEKEDALEKHLGLVPVEVARQAADVAPSPRPARARRKRMTGRAGAEGTVLAPPRLDVVAAPAPAPPPAPPPSKPEPAQPIEPQMPAGPSFSWSRVGTYLLSERTLNGLLGLGAFLILAAGVVISTINPTGLGSVLHLIATVATTVVLYAAGYFVRQKLHLPKAGAVLLAIGAAFVPLVIWTLGTDTALKWDRSTIWLVASTVALPVYFASHVVLRDRTSAVLTAIAGCSELLAVTHWVGVPLEWGIAGLVLLAMGYLLLSGRIQKGWPVLTWALFWSAQAITPLVMLALMAGKYFPDWWKTAATVAPSSSYEYAVGAAWWLGVVFYLTARKVYGEQRYEYAAAWTLPFAYLFTLTKAPWGAAWYGLCLAVLAVAYFAVEWWMHSRLEPAQGPLWKQVALRPWYQVALALTTVAAGWPFATRTTLTATLFTLVAAYGLAAILLKQRAWAYVSVYVLPFAFGLTLDHVTVEGRPLAWVLLSIALLSLGETLLQLSGESRRQLAETVIGLGKWQSRFASPALSAGYAVGLYGLWLCLGLWWDAPASMGVRDLNGLVILALYGVVASYCVSAATRHTSLFLYPASWLSIIPITSSLWIVFDRLSISPSEADWARILAVLGVGYVGTAVFVDRMGGHYAKPLYLMGYALSVLTMFLSSLDRAINVQVVGLSIALYAWSAWRVHTNRHPSYLWLVTKLFPDETSTGFRTARNLFLYMASWLFPLWMLLAMSLRRPAPDPEHYGLALALLAPVYVAAGYGFRRIDRDYSRPWYIAGYALSAIGPLVATANRPFLVVSLTTSILLYAGSAVVSRRSVWLYLVAVLVPVLLWQILELAAVPFRYFGVAFVVLGLVYGVSGVILHHGGASRLTEPIRDVVSEFAQPFFVVSYLLTGLGLALVSLQEHGLVMLAFGLAAVHFAGSGFVFRDSVFGYPASVAVAVVYVVGMITLSVEARFYGLALLPGVGAYLVAAETMRRRLDRAGASIYPWDGLRLDSWSTPVYACLYAGTVAVPLASPEWTPLALGFFGIATVYGASAALFRHPAWIYPGATCALGGYVSAAYALEPGLSTQDALALLVLPTWILLWSAFAVQRFVAHSESAPPWTLTGDTEAWWTSWARPLLHVGLIAVVVSAGASLESAPLALKVGSAYLVLLSILALLWTSEVMAWGSVAFLAVVVQEGLRLQDVAPVAQPVVWAVAGLLAIVISFVIPRIPLRRLRIWYRPLYVGSIAIGGVALITSLAYQMRYHTDAALQSLAITTAVSGLALVAHGFNRRDRVLTYVGVALVEVGCMLELLVFNVGEPQAFALPAGLYLLAVAYLEWRRGSAEHVKDLLESAGLAILLGTSLLQAVGLLGVGDARYAYDTFLLIEAVLVFALGATLRWKKTFFSGAAAVVADVCILLADPVHAMNTWYLIALIGFGMVSLVVFAEQRRQQIPIWVGHWRDQLEDWS